MGFGGKDIKNNSKYKIMKIKIMLFQKERAKALP